MGEVADGGSSSSSSLIFEALRRLRLALRLRDLAPSDGRGVVTDSDNDSLGGDEE